LNCHAAMRALETRSISFTFAIASMKATEKLPGPELFSAAISPAMPKARTAAVAVFAALISTAEQAAMSAPSAHPRPVTSAMKGCPLEIAIVRPSADEMRSIGPVSTLPEFAKAFGCKPGDPMVRKDACQIW